MKRFSMPLAAFLLSIAMPWLAASAVADPIDEALVHPGRPPGDSARDQLDHPAEMLRLLGIKPGMHVLDFLAGDGYYSELLNFVVGPTGQVVLLNNKSFDDWSQPALSERLEA